MLYPIAAALLAGQALASPAGQLDTRQWNWWGGGAGGGMAGGGGGGGAAGGACPPLHVFGARETTAPAGMGTAGGMVNQIVQAHPGATSEAINYPACGGQGQCGGIQYGDSVNRGTAAVAQAVNAFNERCPDSEIVLVGYSQGGQIMDNAFCGGGDSHSGISATEIPISEAAQEMVKAALFMGSPRHIPGLSYNVGTCRASGFAPRPNGFQCPWADRVQNYCDAQDPYCCNGNDSNHHQQYVNIYGREALAFVNEHVTA